MTNSNTSSQLAMPKEIPVASPESLRRGLRARTTLKGRQPTASAVDDVRALIGAPPHRRDMLIEHLHALNDAYRALHDHHLVALSAEMGLPMAEVYEVASFYHHFDIVRAGESPPPAVTVRVCEGLPCELAGGGDLLARLGKLLDTTVRVISAPCVGRCETAPVAVVHQRPVLHATCERVVQTLRDNALEHPIAADDAEFDPVRHPTPASRELSPAYVGYDAYRAAGGYALARAIVLGDRDANEVLTTMEASELRGLGGAGFPAGRKWRIVRDQPAPRLMAVNIDEGEPGTFKDRTYLERDPHRFLEGVLIAASVVGIDAVYIYLRDEYHGCRALLSREIARLQADPPCRLPVFHLRRGAGAYICGEESAMIESIEGKRGEPRMRPPYIAQVGLFGRPTLEHNFETLYWVRDIVSRGAPWFTSFGRRERKGLRSFSVSGRVKHPGVKRAPAGITARELIDEYCGGMQDGHDFYAYLPGGASGGILPASLGDVPLDFDTLHAYGAFIGSAAVIVLSSHDRARDAALNAMRFFAHESCGQCTPCRVGTAKATALMQAPHWDADTLDDLNTVMADASICGLGQAAPNPVRSVLRYFAREVS
ncbi:MAG TPA: NADH-ubiquinone oxidoreductase-F iron-sulfur binding region domain-containing protein [Burkholderiaceae bacterium]|nr:NADH-ubiquinone oxidoreductase-F iron-sulfur binding region domain-containing protein [Burkholderiaceae bacterium]